MNQHDGLSEIARLLANVADAEDKAAQAFSATLEFAAGEVTVRWADPLPPLLGPDGHPVAHLPVFDMRYPVARGGQAPDPRWRDAHLEWSFGISELRDARAGEVVFAAGVALPTERGGLLDEDAEWLGRRRGEGFERLHNPRLHTEQLLRWLDVDDVLAAGEPVDQGDLVADWVVATFELLAADPPGSPSP